MVCTSLREAAPLALASGISAVHTLKPYNNFLNARVCILSYYDVASGSEITPCNKIVVVYRFSGNVLSNVASIMTIL